MKIISINVEIDRHHDTVNALIKKEDPDVVCMQELLEEDFEYFKNQIGMGGVYIPTVYIYSHAHGGPQNKRYGLGIFAKQILNTGYSYYVGSEAHINQSFEEYFTEIPVIQDRGLLWADIDVAGVAYRVATTHFTITPMGSVTDYQLGCLDSLFTALDTLGEFMLLGDMNAPRGLETWRRLAEKYKDNIPAQYETSIDQHLHRVKGLQLMVDGLFTTSTYEATNVRLVDGVSDHMAVVANVTKCD